MPYDKSKDGEWVYRPPTEEELSRTFFSAKDQGAKIREHMVQKGETLNSLAEKAGVGTRFIWDILNGQDRPEYTYILQICEVLGIKPEMLVFAPDGEWASKLADTQSEEIPDIFEYIDPYPNAKKVETDVIVWRGDSYWDKS